MAWAIRSIMGGCWRAARWAYRRGGSSPDRAAILIPALVAALLAAACGINSRPASGIDAPNNTSPDASPAEPDAPIDTPPPGWLHPWKQRKPIALLASKIEAPSDTELTDFPVLVSLTDQEIVASARADGADIVFTAADGTTVLASEIESFTTFDQKLVAWVKLPSLSATVDTTIFLYYGNSTPAIREPGEVWTANYLGVWHLNQDPVGGGTIRDATSGNHVGTANNMLSDALAPAQCGRGLKFDGMASYLSFTSANLGNAFTISMWLNYADVTSSGTLLTNSKSGHDSNGLRFFINTASSNPGDRRLIFETGDGNLNSGQTAQSDANAVPIGAFTHVTAVVDRNTGTTLLFVDGTSVATSMSTSTTFRTNSDFQVGQIENNDSRFSGQLDEIEIATELRSPEWIRTSFNNQSVPDSFYTLSAEELEP